jgi:SAM-dependent methyltransferase
MEPWGGANVAPAFLQALSERRSIQARQIIDHFRDTLGTAPILDYGCGQGVFVRALASEGFRVVGCDLSQDVTRRIDPRIFVGLDRPWSIPVGVEFDTVILLDVLEHSPDPRDFVARLRSRGARQLLVKVPLASGPLFIAAKAMAWAGYPGVLENLFLVGDVAPHEVYFTARGLRGLLASVGFQSVSHFSLGEVGRELPSRVRDLPPSWRLTRSALTGVGRVVEYLAPVWPDTAVFLFREAG